MSENTPADDGTTAVNASLTALREKHPELVTVSVKSQTVAFRPMTRQEYVRWRSQVMDADKRAGALEALVRAVVVYPDRTAFNAFLDRYPAAAEAIGDAVLDAGGAGKVEAL